MHYLPDKPMLPFPSNNLTATKIETSCVLHDIKSFQQFLSKWPKNYYDSKSRPNFCLRCRVIGLKDPCLRDAFRKLLYVLLALSLELEQVHTLTQIWIKLKVISQILFYSKKLCCFSCKQLATGCPELVD